MDRSLPALFSIVALGSLALSACHHHSDGSVTLAQGEDVRELKNYTAPGAWFCTLSLPYSETVSGVNSTKEDYMVATAENRALTKQKLVDDCAEAPAAVKDECVKQMTANDDLCVQTSLYLPKYKELAEQTGHWACEMSFTYTMVKPATTTSSTPAKPAAAQPAGSRTSFPNEIGNGLLALAAPDPVASATPTPSPSVSPSPAPVLITKSDRISIEGTTALAAITGAFETCAAVTTVEARTACAKQMMAYDSATAMQCWNKDLGKNAQPKRKVVRHKT